MSVRPPTEMNFTDLINQVKNNTIHLDKINDHNVDLYYNKNNKELYQIKDNEIRKLKLYKNNNKNKYEFYNIHLGIFDGKQKKLSLTVDSLLSKISE